MTSPSRPPDSDPWWTHFVGGLRAFVGSRVPARDADDVTQEALLRIHRGAFTGGAAPERPQAWIFGVARHVIADYYRGRRPVEDVGDSPLDTLSDPTARTVEKLARFDGDHSVHEEVLGWLRPTAEQLPDGYREALILADFEGVSQREVASRLGLSLPGAKSRVQRARKMLALELDRCCKIELGEDGRVEDFERRRSCDC